MEPESGDLVRAACRTLEILRAMNRRPVTTIEVLHRETGLPKPTLVRFLKTLTHAGYVTNDRRHAGYQLTARVLSLSAGYHGDPLVVEAGKPVAMRLTSELRWPVSIAVFDGDAMVVRLSTVVDSPMSPFHSTINMRLSLFTRGLGRAYLAFCDDARIRTLAEAVVASGAEGADIAGDPLALAAMVTLARRRGFALRDPRIEPLSSDTLAVPIFINDEVRATLGMTYFRAAMRSQKHIEHCVALLKQASAEISVETARLMQHYDPEDLLPVA